MDAMLTKLRELAAECRGMEGLGSDVIGARIEAFAAELEGECPSILSGLCDGGCFQCAYFRDRTQPEPPR